MALPYHPASHLERPTYVPYAPAGFQHTLGPTFSDEEDGDDTTFIAERIRALGIDPHAVYAAKPAPSFDPFQTGHADCYTGKDTYKYDTMPSHPHADRYGRYDYHESHDRYGRNNPYARYDLPPRHDPAAMYDLHARRARSDREALLALAMKRNEMEAQQDYLDAYRLQLQQAQLQQRALSQLQLAQINHLSNAGAAGHLPALTLGQLTQSEQTSRLNALRQIGQLPQVSPPLDMDTRSRDTGGLPALARAAPPTQPVRRLGPNDPTLRAMFESAAPAPAPLVFVPVGKPTSPVSSRTSRTDGKAHLAALLARREERTAAREASSASSASSPTELRKTMDETKARGEVAQHEITARGRATQPEETGTAQEEQKQPDPRLELGFGRPQTHMLVRRAATLPALPAGPHSGVARVVRQPTGPPSSSAELVTKNFATRMRQQAGKQLGMLGRRIESA
ncbi:hypothetical protein Q5752_004734 [Cryptotrichosporon argae]